jgi:dipeptidyl aminopeptidase/acylaminoacyl peptidase
VRPSDLDHLAVPGDPQLHPDGLRVAYVLSEVDVDDDRYVRTIHLWDGQRTRRFTHGPSDTSPRWSPDGRWLAFLRTGTEEGQKPQLHVMPADGGEAQRRTDLPLGVSALEWSPDSTRLAIVAATYRPELADLDDDERRRRPKRITRLPYRTDSQGWIHDRHERLWVVAATGHDEPRCLTPADRDVSSPMWRPDGTAVAFLREPDDWPETEPHNEVVEVDVDPDAGDPDQAADRAGADDADTPDRADTAAAAAGADDADTAAAAGADDADTADTTEVAFPPPRPLVGPGIWSAVHYDADGRVLVAGLRDPLDWPAPAQVWLRVDAVAEREAAAGDDRSARHAGLVSLTGHLDRDALPGSPACVTSGPRFVAGGFLTALEGRGSSGVVKVHLDGWDPNGGAPPEVTEVVGGHRAVTGFAARPDGTAIAFTATDVATPGELYWREDGRERCLTDLTRGFRAKVDVRPTQRFTFARDGVELDVWAVLPDGLDDAAERSVPVLFNIHGGPTAQYGDHFFDEFQVQAGAGYLVVGTNPRGSSGRGRDWARAVVGAWASQDSVDTLDLEAVVDATLARFPQADPDRVGIMGGSYGGYVTARLLARTDRYGSAVVERGLLQWESFAGTSDIGSYFDRMFLGVGLDDGAEVHHAASPVRTAHRITTPTLVVHSEADWRCPPEQGEQLFAALKRAGVTTEMLRFPDETHELSRSGAPKHRVERLEAILAWHERCLRREAT